MTAERWLARACPEGSAPASAVLTMTGQIKLKQWLPFTATQWIDVKRGFVWAARVVRWPLVISGSDRYVASAGAMSWRLWGIVPVMRASGPDVTRSAAWRFFAESLAWLPGPRPDVQWSAAGPDAIVAEAGSGPDAPRVTLRLADDGRVLSLSGPRWGNPLGRPYGYYDFGVDVLEEMTVNGRTVPSRVRASWGWGQPWQAEGEFFRADISEIRFDAKPGSS
jgi:hypothetical protein